MTENEETVTIRTYMLGLAPYAVVEYDELDGELTVSAGGADPKLIEKMLRSAAYRVKRERKAQRKQSRKPEGVSS